MSGPARVLVVDDEHLARDGLRVLLERDEQVRVVGECRDGREAVEEIRRLEPDVVFLDVQMPERDGFEVLEALDPEEIPVVVFVTAYDEYALRAFEVHALDYLLKPFDDERFERALRRAKDELERRDSARFAERLEALLAERREEEGEAPNRTDGPAAADPDRPGAADGPAGSGEPPAAEPLDRLMVRSSGRIQFVSVGEIDWVEAAGDYVRLHVGERSHLLRETMKSLEVRLDADDWVRVHRSTLVRLDYVREIRTSESGHYELVLEDGTRRSLSRSGRERLEEVLGRSI